MRRSVSESSASSRSVSISSVVLVERVCSKVGDGGGDGVLGGFGRGGRMPCLRRASLLE
jgi:hypothetical protein